MSNSHSSPAQTFSSRRFVSFAAEDALNCTEAFAAKFGDAAGLGEALPDDLVGSTPTWLMQDSTGTSASTEDVMDEFLADDDMLRLEMECLKWYELSDRDMKALSKLDEDMASKLLECHRDMSTFLKYRQQLTDNHARKASVKTSMRRKTILGGEEVQTIEEEGDEDEEIGEDDEPQEAKETPTASHGARGTKIGSDMAAKAYKRRSVVAMNRRQSVSAKLARAGTQISNTSEEGLLDTPTSHASARGGRRPTIAADAFDNMSPKGRKSVFAKQPAAIDRARRMSMAANKAQMVQMQETPRGKKSAEDFKSNMSQGSDTDGAGQEKVRLSRLGTRKF